MDSSASNCFDIFLIYRQFCDIMSGAYASWGEGFRVVDGMQKAKSSKEALNQLSKFMESKVYPRMSVFDEVFKLMSRLELTVDFYEFSRFYDFVFFICREDGQKNITVSRAVTAWRLVLAGRFRLLNHWCDFVEKNQRHNISEDTWRQVLAFSRCVHENLEGYDPEGAWPVIIDEFVDHMYRITGSNNNKDDKASCNMFCNCDDGSHVHQHRQPSEDPLPGLKICPGLKRKMETEMMEVDEPEQSPLGDALVVYKRRHIFCAEKRRQPKNLYNKSTAFTNNNGTKTTSDDDEDENNTSQVVVGGCKKSSSPCGAEEGGLLKGFAGLLSNTSPLCLRYDPPPERRVS